MHDSRENILSLRLFGSHARGEADAGSDIDVLLVLEEGNISPPPLHLPGDPDISIYSRERIERMFSEGHLFAWHLFLESIPYFSNSLDIWFDSLGEPSEYREAQQDIIQFIGILEEALDGIESGENYVFEAGIAHLAMRNLGMILSHDLTGVPNFSRYAALQLPTEVSLQIAVKDYEVLLACRRISARGDQTIELPSCDNVNQAVLPAREWVNGLKRKL